MDNALDILNYGDFLFVVPVKCRSIIGYELYRAPPPPKKKQLIKGRLILYVHVFSVPKTMSSNESLYFSELFLLLNTQKRGVWAYSLKSNFNKLHIYW